MIRIISKGTLPVWQFVDFKYSHFRESVCRSIVSNTHNMRSKESSHPYKKQGERFDIFKWEVFHHAQLYRNHLNSTYCVVPWNTSKMSVSQCVFLLLRSLDNRLQIYRLMIQNKKYPNVRSCHTYVVPLYRTNSTWHCKVKVGSHKRVV